MDTEINTANDVLRIRHKIEDENKPISLLPTAHFILIPSIHLDVYI